MVLHRSSAGDAFLPRDDMVPTLVGVYAELDPEWRKDAAIAALSSVSPQNLDTVRSFLAVDLLAV